MNILEATATEYGFTAVYELSIQYNRAFGEYTYYAWVWDSASKDWRFRGSVSLLSRTIFRADGKVRVGTASPWALTRDLFLRLHRQAREMRRYT